MVKLVPMTEAEFETYLDDDIRRYAEANVKAGHWLPSEALEKSRQVHDHLLPDGLATKDEFFFSIVSEAGEKIGILWVEVKTDASPRRAFVYDFWIQEELRGQGYGRLALAALDDTLRSMDVESVSLHVFGDNLTAQALYKKTGFEITGIHMRKKYK
ncbi:MAG: GNAT family N-acetyltransferase [Chloroflexota bacterium]